MANAKARTRTTVTQRRSNASKPAAAVLTPEQEAAEAELPKLREANKRKRDDAIARPLRDRILASKPQPGTDDYVRAVVALAQDERDQIEKAIRHDLEHQQDRTPDFPIPVEGQNGTRQSVAYPPPTSAEALARDYLQAAVDHRLWHIAKDDLERRDRSTNAAQIKELAEAHRALLTDAMECARSRRRNISDEVSDQHRNAVLQAQELIRSGALLPQSKPAETPVEVGGKPAEAVEGPRLIPAVKFWRDKFETYPAFKAFLKRHPNIETGHKGQQLLIDANAATLAHDGERQTKFEALGEDADDMIELGKKLIREQNTKKMRQSY